MREQAASDNPVTSPIALSEKASSFGAISRLNHASSRWPGCSILPESSRQVSICKVAQATFDLVATPVDIRVAQK